MAVRQLELKLGAAPATPALLLRCLRSHEPALQDFLLEDMTHLHPSAKCDVFGLQEVVAENDDAYHLSYRFAWSATYGCADREVSETEVQMVQFRYANGMARFELPIFPTSSTADEL